LKVASSGTYKCQATNNVGTVTLDKKINVSATPKVKVSTSSISPFFENLRYTIDCTVTDVSSENVKWMFDDGKVVLEVSSTQY
jgi:hypothetical protein